MLKVIIGAKVVDNNGNVGKVFTRDGNYVLVDFNTGIKRIYIREFLSGNLQYLDSKDCLLMEKEMNRYAGKKARQRDLVEKAIKIAATKPNGKTALEHMGAGWFIIRKCVRYGLIEGYVLRYRNTRVNTTKEWYYDNSRDSHSWMMQYLNNHWYDNISLDSAYVKMDSGEIKVYYYRLLVTMEIEKNPGITTNELIRNLSISQQIVTNTLSHLTNQRIIVVQNERYYILK